MMIEEIYLSFINGQFKQANSQFIENGLALSELIAEWDGYAGQEFTPENVARFIRLVAEY